MTGWSTRCYMLDPVGSNSMKSRNPNSGFHEIGVWPCLDTSSQNPVKGQGGRRRVLALDGDKWKIRPSDNYERAGGNGFGICAGEVMYTLNTVDRHIVAVTGDEG